MMWTLNLNLSSLVFSFRNCKFSRMLFMAMILRGKIELTFFGDQSFFCLTSFRINAHSAKFSENRNYQVSHAKPSCGNDSSGKSGEQEFHFVDSKRIDVSFKNNYQVSYRDRIFFHIIRIHFFLRVSDSENDLEI